MAVHCFLKKLSSMYWVVSLIFNALQSHFKKSATFHVTRLWTPPPSPKSLDVAKNISNPLLFLIWAQSFSFFGIWTAEILALFRNYFKNLLKFDSFPCHKGIHVCLRSILRRLLNSSRVAGNEAPWDNSKKVFYSKKSPNL